MIQDTSKGKIFLAGERGCTENDWFRSFNTFNFGQYQQANKSPFGALYVMNDDTLAGEKSFELMVEEDSEILLLPIVGTVHYTDSAGNETFVDAGQAQHCYVTKNTKIQFRNPYEKELINFVHYWIKSPKKNTNRQPDILSINFENNKLISLSKSVSKEASHASFIGRFNGRAETVYQLQKESNGFFVFVIQGAFEVQYRLLEWRDGLALWNVPEIEIEALSNEAIILLIETELS